MASAAEKDGEREGDKDGLDGGRKHYEKGHLLIQHLKNSPGQRALPLIIKGKETRAKEVGCNVRHGTQDLTRATGASKCIPRTKSYDPDSATEGDQTGASQAQEHDEEKERRRGTTRPLRVNGQPPQRLKDSKARHERWRTSR